MSRISNNGLGLMACGFLAFAVVYPRMHKKKKDHATGVYCVGGDAAFGCLALHELIHEFPTVS